MREILRTFRVSINLTGSAPQNTDRGNRSIWMTAVPQAESKNQPPVPMPDPLSFASLEQLTV